MTSSRLSLHVWPLPTGLGTFARRLACAAPLVVAACGPELVIYESGGTAAGSAGGTAGSTGTGTTGSTQPASGSSSGLPNGTTSSNPSEGTTRDGDGTTGALSTTFGSTGDPIVPGSTGEPSTGEPIVPGTTSSPGTSTGESGLASTGGETTTNGPEPIDWAFGCFEDTPTLVPEVPWLAVMRQRPHGVWSRPEGVYVRAGDALVRFDHETAAPDLGFASEGVLDPAVDGAEFAITADALFMVGGAAKGTPRIERWALPSGLTTASTPLPGLAGVSTSPYHRAGGLYVHEGLVYVFFPAVDAEPAETVRVFDVDTLELVETITTSLIPEYEQPVDVRVEGFELALVSEHAGGHGRQVHTSLGSGVPFHDTTTGFQMWPTRFLNHATWPPIWVAYTLNSPYVLTFESGLVLVPNDFYGGELNMYSPEDIPARGGWFYPYGRILGGDHPDRGVGKRAYPSDEIDAAFGEAGLLTIDPSEGRLDRAFAPPEALFVSRYDDAPDWPDRCYTLERRSLATGAPL